MYKKSKFSSRATKKYENKSDLHEISRRIDWERPQGPPKGPQEGPKRIQEGPKSAQEGPKSCKK